MVFNVQKPQDVEGAIIEAWAQGYMIGSLIIMACIAFSNMRRGVLLHKIIVIEVWNLPPRNAFTYQTFALTREPAAGVRYVSWHLYIHKTGCL